MDEGRQQLCRLRQTSKKKKKDKKDANANANATQKRKRNEKLTTVLTHILMNFLSTISSFRVFHVSSPFQLLLLFLFSFVLSLACFVHNAAIVIVATRAQIGLE